MKPFQPAEMRTFIHAMCAVAWADREIQDQERKILEGFVDASELGEDVRSEAAAWFQTPVALGDVAWEILGPAVRIFVYRSAVELVKADNKLQASESDCLKAMVIALQIEPAEVESINASHGLV